MDMVVWDTGSSPRVAPLVFSRECSQLAALCAIRRTEIMRASSRCRHVMATMLAFRYTFRQSCILRVSVLCWLDQDRSETHAEETRTREHARGKFTHAHAHAHARASPPRRVPDGHRQASTYLHLASIARRRNLNVGNLDRLAPPPIAGTLQALTRL